MIIFQCVSKTYNSGKTLVVKDLSFDINEGELFVIMGSSGSGKSTALKMLNRMVEPTSGSITINGKNILSIPVIELRRSMGYVLQKAALFPHMTVAENINIILRIHKVEKEQGNQQFIHGLLSLVNLDPDIYADRYPKELSGGQQQRVGIARALAINSNYILMDEPFSALDAITRETMQQEIRDLQKKLNKTVIFVTHDMFEAFEMADRIAIIDHGELQQIGKPQDILNRPATPFVEQMIAPFKRQVLTYYDKIEAP